MPDCSPKSRWNPNQVRRRVREIATLDGLHAFKTKSFTNSSEEWHPIVDIATGKFECDCPDWVYRKSKSNTPCKHITRALLQLQRKGAL